METPLEWYRLETILAAIPGVSRLLKLFPVTRKTASTHLREKKPTRLVGVASRRVTRVESICDEHTAEAATFMTAAR